LRFRLTDEYTRSHPSHSPRLVALVAFVFRVTVRLTPAARL
jgi:hypothetical protein